MEEDLEEGLFPLLVTMGLPFYGTPAWTSIWGGNGSKTGAENGGGSGKGAETGGGSGSGNENGAGAGGDKNPPRWQVHLVRQTRCVVCCGREINVSCINPSPSLAVTDMVIYFSVTNNFPAQDASNAEDQRSVDTGCGGL